MDKHWIEGCHVALNKAEEEFNKAVYLEECGSNPGIRKMNANKAEWLKYVVYLAKLGFTEVQRDNKADAVVISSDTSAKSAFQRVLERFQTINNTGF